MKPLLITALVLVILLVTLLLLHTWYVDTHCTTILGTQVCQ